jgi:hypothetical protein
MGFNLGMIVEGSVAILLAVTIGYCIMLNHRLKRLHSDREMLGKMVGDLVQATSLANAAIMELKTTALEADTKLGDRLEEAARLERDLSSQVSNGAQLVEKIARITAAARTQPLPEPARPEAAKPALAVEPHSRLHSALQQLAMRPGIGGKAA